MEALLLYCLQVYFVYYLLNHATMFDKVRAAILPALPWWLRELIECPFCVGFWVTFVLSLLVGFSYLILCAPPVVLFMDAAYCRLKIPAEPPILPPTPQ